MSSFIFSRSDIECLVLPILEQLHKSDEGSSHHLYMMLIILLILSQDEVFSKSIHEIVSFYVWVILYLLVLLICRYQ